MVILDDFLYFFPEIYGPRCNNTDFNTYATSKDSDQLMHPRSLIRVFTDSLKKLQGLSQPYAKQSLSLGCTDVQVHWNIGMLQMPEGPFCFDAAHMLWEVLLKIASMKQF